jgi:hypothetical protein
LLHAVQQWRIDAKDVFGGRQQFTTHHRLQQDPPPAFFDGPTQLTYTHPPYVSFADPQQPPPPPPPSRYSHHPPAQHLQQAPPPPPGPSQRPSALRQRTPPPPPPPASAISAGKSLLTYATSATHEHRSIATAVEFMNAVGGRAPVLATKGIGPYKSDRQLCLAFCFEATPFTGCRGNTNNRPCHRLHLDCSSPDALPATAVAPLVTWLRSDRVRTLVVPTPAFLETNWWRHTP